MAIAPSPFLLFRASGISFAPRPPAAALPGLAWTNLPDLRLAVGGLRLSSGATPRRVFRCSVHFALSKPPQPTPDAKGAGVPERKIGSEALEASAKLRKSSIDCLSAASFEAARSEQRRLPAEVPLKRGDGSSCKSMTIPWQDRVFNSRKHTFRALAGLLLTGVVD
jgi:hypothetical protein